MNDISTYFTVDNESYKDTGIVVFKFDDARASDFIMDCIIPFRDAYISNEELSKEVENNISSRESAIANRVPTKACLKSGEFGEILVFYLAQKFLANDANIIPIKWRWKETQDMPCHLTDIILLRCDDENSPKKEDYICTVEVKSAATPLNSSSPSSPINKAVEDAVKDKDSRIAKTIIYLKKQYIRDNEFDKARKITRFEDGVQVSYNRIINAAIVVDKESLQNHISNLSNDNKIKATNNTIGLFAIPMKNLKQIYEGIYCKLPKEG